MKRVTTRKSSTRNLGDKAALARKLFTALALVLRQQGIASAEIRAVCLEAASKADSATKKPPRIPASKDSALLGSALALWFRDSRFLDQSGLPRPLRAYGRSPSVESLLRTAEIRRNTKESVRFLLESGLVVKSRNGKCIPTNRSARIPKTDAYFVEHIAQGVMKLVQTAHFNFTPAGMQQPLLQRAASIRRLPRKHKAAFREYVNQQGNAFITNIDDWLEARAMREKQSAASSKSKSSATSAGVYAFAYVD